MESDASNPVSHSLKAVSQMQLSESHSMQSVTASMEAAIASIESVTIQWRQSLVDWDC